MSALSSLKFGAEELEMINANLNQEVVITKQKYEWQLNLARLQQERVELLYNALVDENQKLISKLQEKNGAAYELSCYYQILVKEIEFEKEKLHEENVHLRNELQGLENRANKELERLNRVIKDVHKERDSLQEEYKEQLKNEQSKTEEIRNVNTKLHKQLEDLAKTVVKQKNEISTLAMRSKTTKKLRGKKPGDWTRENPEGTQTLVKDQKQIHLR